MFIATDGAPTDGEAVKTAIREIAAVVKDPREFCLSFLTVGVINAGLRAFLRVRDEGNVV